MSIDRRYSVAEGTAIKAPCLVATTATITLSGLQTIDGVTVAEHDRVLVKDQLDTTLNGIYEASTGNWLRTKDFDGARDIVRGTRVYIASGTLNVGVGFRVTTADPIVIGTSGITFGSATEADSVNIDFTPAGTGAQSSDLRTRGRLVVYVMDFIPKGLWSGIEAGTDTTDLKNYEQAAATYIAGQNRSRKLIYPSGRYYRSIAPNWAIQDAEIEAEGEVRIRYTGTGNAIILDGLAISLGGVYNTRIKNFIVEAPSTAGNAFSLSAIHQGLIDGCVVLGCGSGSAGFFSAWCVGTTFNRPMVSVNHEGWFSSAKPLYGMFLTQGSPGNHTSYCNIINAYMEGPDVGVSLDHTFGNNFFGGAFEGCAVRGLEAAANSFYDKIVGVDFEVNPTVDISLAGHDIRVVNCDTANVVSFTATSARCKLIGGEHQSIVLDVAANNCSVMDLTYNRLGGGSFTNASELTYYRNLYDFGNGVVFQDPTRNVTVNTSPFDVTVRRNIAMVSVHGGTVTKISLVRDGTANDLSEIAGTFVIGPGDKLRIESSLAPAVQVFPFTA